VLAGRVVNVLINIAGGFAMGEEAFDCTSGQWDWMFMINVDTKRNATLAAVSMLLVQGGGSIVNIDALGALSGQAAMSRPLLRHILGDVAHRQCVGGAETPGY